MDQTPKKYNKPASFLGFINYLKIKFVTRDCKDTCYIALGLAFTIFILPCCLSYISINYWHYCVFNAELSFTMCSTTCIDCKFHCKNCSLLETMTLSLIWMSIVFMIIVTLLVLCVNVSDLWNAYKKEVQTISEKDIEANHTTTMQLKL